MSIAIIDQIMSINSSVLFLLMFLKLCLAYRPVVLVHGILTGPASMLIIEGEVKKVKDRINLNFPFNVA